MTAPPCHTPKTLRAILRAVGHGLGGALSCSRPETRPCPWIILGIETSKWPSGKRTADIRVLGHFPSCGESDTQPVWYVNGIILRKTRRIPEGFLLSNAACLLMPGPNTIRVRITHPFLRETESVKTIYDFSWQQIHPGEARMFR